MAIEKIFNHSLPKARSAEAAPLDPVEAFGWNEVDTETGEVLKSCRNWFQAVPQVGVPSFAEEAGDPRLVNVMHARDLKSRAMALIGDRDLTTLFGGEPASDDDALPLLFDDNDDEADAFNEAMSSTPYACDDEGVANYESAIAKDKQDLEGLRDYMEKKDDPLFQAFAALSEEERLTIMDKATAPAPVDGTEPPK